LPNVSKMQIFSKGFILISLKLSYM